MIRRIYLSDPPTGLDAYSQNALELPHRARAAKLVKLADKIANVRDVADHPPSEWPMERRREYFDWAKRVVDGLRGTHAGLEAAFDAAYARRP
jgi:GTP diphosphokinase / guanosine-3',5'-bis(diphosphate) 3'-diphosphatase